MNKNNLFKISILGLLALLVAPRGFSSDLPQTYSDYLNPEAVEACLNYETPSELVLNIAGSDALATLLITKADSSDEELIYSSTYRRNVKLTVRENSIHWGKTASLGAIQSSASNALHNSYHKTEAALEQAAQSTTNAIIKAWNKTWNATSDLSQKTIKKSFTKRAEKQGLSNHKHDSKVDSFLDMSCSRNAEACRWALGQVIREFSEVITILDPSSRGYEEKLKAINCARVRAQLKHDKLLGQ